MTDATLPLRQIHPKFIQHDRVTSQAFRPTPKDENQLSVDNGDRISAAESFALFFAQPECLSAGVMAVSQGECQVCGVQAVEDGVPYIEHCYLDFAPFGGKQVNRIGKKLLAKAQGRGWLFEAK